MDSDGPTGPSAGYVSRAGRKLEAALSAFGLDAAGLICADFGCNVGGFTDCLLQHGAATVYAVDTGYGVLIGQVQNCVGTEHKAYLKWSWSG